MHRVEIAGWREGVPKVSIADVLREQAELGPAEAGASAERVLGGEPVTLELPTRAEAVALASALNAVGAEAVVVDPGSAA